MSLHIIILAAGQGKRMHSQRPKVLHELGGKALLIRVVETAQQLNPAAIHIVYGHGGEMIQEALKAYEVNWVYQAEQCGTGHAVQQTLPFIPDEAHVLILSGDVPLIQVSTLKKLVDLNLTQTPLPLSLLVAVVNNPFGLGRIIRNEQGALTAIVEERDATEAQKHIHEIYSGVCCVSALALKRWLPQLTPHNAQGEFYLTDIIRFAVEEGHQITSLQANNEWEILGINNRLQLQQLERILQQQIAHDLLLKGVSLADAARLDVRGDLHCDEDVFIDVNVIIQGNVTIGKGSKIGPNCVLTHVIIGDYVEILANSVLEHAEIGDYSHVGPFARLRPGSKLGDHCKIGNFVETKNTTFASGSKANHLSYVGDTTVGKHVNIGAGTITCNYDGANKHQTIIEDDVFIGSSTQLVAPITVGKGATIGAGSTLRKNVPPGELTLTEAKQKTIPGWQRPIKKLKDK